MSEEWIVYDDITEMDSEAMAAFLEILEKAIERDRAQGE